jgi:hypothetical protein
MYRDDVCAVCGESLPPDHFYCREHAAEVDDRLQRIGDLLPRVTADLARLAVLVDDIAEPTWDYLAEAEPDDPEWPPVPAMGLRADAEEVDVDLDSEPGFVRVDVRVSLARLLTAVANALHDPRFARVAEAAAKAEGANATH